MRTRILQQLAAIARFYAPLFGGRILILTNTVTSGILMGAADVIQQSLERRQKPMQEWDIERMSHMFITGCLMGPPLHYWYYWVDKIAPRTRQTSRIRIVIIKVALDQSFAPAFGYWYFTVAGVLQGHSLKQCLDEFKDKFWDYYLAELTLWPTAQVINFLFLPSHYRVLFVNVVTLGWNVYLSYIKYKD